MTTRRDVLIGIAGVAAAVAVPVEAIARAPVFTTAPFTPRGGIIYYDGIKVGDIVTIEYDGSTWRVIDSYCLEPVHAGDLREGEEYSIVFGE